VRSLSHHYQRKRHFDVILGQGEMNFVQIQVIITDRTERQLARLGNRPKWRYCTPGCESDSRFWIRTSHFLFAFNSNPDYILLSFGDIRVSRVWQTDGQRISYRYYSSSHSDRPANSAIFFAQRFAFAIVDIYRLIVAELLYERVIPDYVTVSAAFFISNLRARSYLYMASFL